MGEFDKDILDIESTLDSPDFLVGMLVLIPPVLLRLSIIFLFSTSNLGVGVLGKGLRIFALSPSFDNFIDCGSDCCKIN